METMTLAQYAEQLKSEISKTFGKSYEGNENTSLVLDQSKVAIEKELNRNGFEFVKVDGIEGGRHFIYQNSVLEACISKNCIAGYRVFFYERNH